MEILFTAIGLISLYILTFYTLIAKIKLKIYINTIK